MRRRLQLAAAVLLLLAGAALGVTGKGLYDVLLMTAAFLLRP